jgi:hypothetical protein
MTQRLPQRSFRAIMTLAGHGNFSITPSAKCVVLTQHRDSEGGFWGSSAKETPYVV